MWTLTNCVSGCDFTTPLFISTDTLFQSDGKVSLQASFIAISYSPSSSLSSFCCCIDLWHWKHHQPCTLFTSALTMLPENKIIIKKKIKILNFFSRLVRVVLFTKRKKSVIRKLNFFFSECCSRNTQGCCASVSQALSHSEQFPMHFGTKHTRRDPESPFHSRCPPIRPEIHMLIRLSRLQGSLIPLTSPSH